MSCLFIDIATVPDFDLGERLYNLQELSDKDIARVMSTKARETGNNTDKLDEHLLQVVGISLLLVNEDGVVLNSSVSKKMSERQHLNFLTDIINQHQPEVITWNADILPVLSYRYLSHAKQLPLAADFPVIDLMRELSDSEQHKPVSLNHVSMLIGLPAIFQLSQESILDAYLLENDEPIQSMLELNVLSTSLIYYRWLFVSGEIDRADYDSLLNKFSSQLLAMNQAHLNDYFKVLNTNADTK